VNSFSAVSKVSTGCFAVHAGTIGASKIKVEVSGQLAFAGSWRSNLKIFEGLIKHKAHSKSKPQIGCDFVYLASYSTLYDPMALATLLCILRPSQKSHASQLNVLPLIVQHHPGPRAVKLDEEKELRGSTKPSFSCHTKMVLEDGTYRLKNIIFVYCDDC